MKKLGKNCDFPAKIPYFAEIKKLGKIKTLKRSSKWLNSPWMHCIIKIDGLIFVSNFAWQLNFIRDGWQFWQMCCISFLRVWETRSI
jgi:hypothetical protein